MLLTCSSPTMGSDMQDNSQVARDPNAAQKDGVCMVKVAEMSEHACISLKCTPNKEEKVKEP